MSFRPHYGHYKYLVILFGLENAPETFQNMINKILWNLIDQAVLVYIEDILINTHAMIQYQILLKKVISRLHVSNLAASIDKCEFYIDRFECLGYIISRDGISMSEEKVEAIRSWEYPKTQQDVQAFMGVSNFS
jgi:hypothetical protein